MKIKLITIGNAEIEFEVTSEKKGLESLAFWQGLPEKCEICGERIIFTFRQPQGFTYYGLRCIGYLQHETNFLFNYCLSVFLGFKFLIASSRYGGIVRKLHSQR
jgi:choline-glycine betaine transporter